MMWYDSQPFMNMGWWMGLVGVFWLVLFGAIAWLLVRHFPPFASETPLRVLKRRFASGEIDAETFQRMRRQLLDASE